MQKALVVIQRYLLVFGLAIAGVTCAGDSTEPSGSHEAAVRVRPVLPAISLESNPPLVLSRLVVIRLPAETLFANTAAFALADTGTAIVAPIELVSTTEPLVVLLDLWGQSGGTGDRYFRGSDTLNVSTGDPATLVTPIPMVYTGPGATALSVRITPRDSTLPAGDTLSFDVLAMYPGGESSFLYAYWSTSVAGANLRQDGRLIGPAVRSAGFVRVVTPTGLRDSTRVTFVPPPSQIAKQGGDGQTGVAGDTLALPLTVLVRAADNLPVAGVSVAFSVQTGGGVVLTPAAITDSLGVARTFVILGTGAGSQQFRATVAGIPPVTFAATALAGPAAAIAKQSGDAQVDTVGKTLALPFTVRVADANANPVTGATVIWLRRVGTGDIAPDTSLTDTLGLAQATYTLGSTGTDTVRATLGGTSAFVEFRATALPGATVVTLTSGAAQTDTVGQALPDSLVVTLTDQATGDPLAGRDVVWTVTAGNATLSDDTVTTSGTGRAGVRLTLGQVAGPVTIRATTVGAVAPVDFAATAVAGAPQQLAFVVSPPDTATAGAVIAPAIVVEVRDTFSNPVPAVGVAVRALMAGVTTVGGRDSTATDSTGRATFDSLVISGAAGNDELRFDAAGLVAARRLIHLRAGAAAAIAKVVGDSQTAYVDSLLAVAPRVRVADGSGNPVSGIAVTWSVAAGHGTLTGATSVTDTLGEAEVGSWRLGPTPGQDTLRAVVAGLDTLVFVATAEALPPAITLKLRDTVVGVGRGVILEVLLEEPAPAGGRSVSLLSDDLGIAGLDSATVTFAAGDTLRLATVLGVAGGTTKVRAAAAGYLPAEHEVTVSAQVVNLPNNHVVNYLGTSNISVSLAAPAPAGGVTVTLVSLDTTRVALDFPVVTFSAGQQNKVTLARGIRPGPAQIVATAPGYIPDTTISTSVATFDILQSTRDVFVGDPSPFVITLKSGGVLAAAPPGGLNATLTARNPGCVAVVGAVNFPEGINTRQDTVQVGAGPFPCQTYVVASAPGVSPDSLLVSAADMPVITAQLPTTDLGAGLQRTHNVGLSYSQHGGRNLIVRSLSPAKVVAQVDATTPGADTAVIFVPHGTNFIQPIIAGVEGVTDTALVVFEMAGYRPDTIVATVRPAFVGLGGINPNRNVNTADSDVEAVTGISIASSGITNVQAIRAGGAISRAATFRVTGASGAVRLYDTTGVRTTEVTATFPIGSARTPSFTLGGLRLDAVAPGVDTVTVELAGAATVTSSLATRINVAPGVIALADTVVQVGAGLFTSNQLGLDGHTASVGGGGHSGITLTLRVLEAGIALLQADDSTAGADSIDIFVPAGVASGKYYVAGVEGILNDTVRVVVSAPGLTPDTVKVVVLQPGLDLQGIVPTVAAGSGARDIFASIGIPNATGTALQLPQRIRPGGTLNRTVTFTLDVPGVAQLVELAGPPELVKVREIPIRGEITPFRVVSGGVGLEPLAPGAVDVEVTMPGVVTVGTGSRTVTVTP